MTNLDDDLRPDLAELRENLYLRFTALAQRISFRPETYRLHVGMTEGMKYPYAQVQHYRRDVVTGGMSWGAGGKMYLSEWMTDSEFFQAVLGLCIGYDSHEVREEFMVDGIRAYGPHVSIEAHKSVADQTDARSVSTVTNS